MPLSGSLARGPRLIDHVVHAEPTPETTRAFARERSVLLREVGRRMMAWTLHGLEPEADDEVPSRVEFEGRLSRRRRKHPHAVATRFGPGTLRRRLDEPLGRRGCSMHPLARRLGLEAGMATPALAERVGRWGTDDTQHEALELLKNAQGVEWSCPSLRTVLGRLRAGMAPHREGAQVDQLVHGLAQARTSQGRFRPTLSVGRDGICVPLRHGVWHEGATATVSVLDRRGTRVGTMSLGQMPQAGQGTRTAQLRSLLQAVFSRGDREKRRLVSGSDAGHHPSPDDHHGLKRGSIRAVPGVCWRGSGLSIFLMPVKTSSHWPTRLSGGGSRGAALGQREAPRAQNQGRWGRAGVTVSVGAASASGALWPNHALRYSLSLHQKTPAVDALSPRQTSVLPPGLWHHGSGL